LGYSRDTPLSRLLINFYSGETPLTLSYTSLMIFITLSITLITRLLLCKINAPRVYLTTITIITFVVLATTFPLRLTFKLSGPGDAFIIDQFSYWLTWMSLTILSVSFYGTYEDLICEGYSTLNRYLMINLLLIIMFVSSNKLFYFFIIFEASIIPIFLIIVGWGYQPEKIKAAYALFFFTAVRAGPLLIVLIVNYYFTLHLEINYNFVSQSSRFYFSIQRILLLTGFLVKLPIYGAHLWLPLAHVEAPVYGSIILAGILLKLGGTGLVRLSKFIHICTFSDGVLVVRLLGIILVRGTCLFITDLKKIIAFSSVSHIGLAIFLIAFRFKNTLWVTFLILIVHAFSSSAIFFVVYYFYLFSNSRNLLVNIGIISVNSVISFFWLISIIARLGGPPAINLLAEIWAFIFSIVFLPKYIPILIIRFILGRVYHFVLYRTIIQGVTIWESYQEYNRNSSVGVIFVALYHSILRCFTLTLVRRFIL